MTDLLDSAETSNQSLADQLHATQSQFELISERVRVKLLEQKDKLRACYKEIDRLGRELDAVRRKEQDGRGRVRVLEGLLGWDTDAQKKDGEQGAKGTGPDALNGAQRKVGS